MGIWLSNLELTSSMTLRRRHSCESIFSRLRRKGILRSSTYLHKLPQVAPSLRLHDNTHFRKRTNDLKKLLQNRWPYSIHIAAGAGAGADTDTSRLQNNGFFSGVTVCLDKYIKKSKEMYTTPTHNTTQDSTTQQTTCSICHTLTTDRLQ